MPQQSDTTRAPSLGWSATMGLVPGYGHAVDEATIAERTALLVRTWALEMAATEKATGHLVSAVLTPSLTIYPVAYGCPEGGERTVTISGGSNPTRVAEHEFDAYADAVEATVLRVQRAMGQTTVRIDFHEIRRSVHSRSVERIAA